MAIPFDVEKAYGARGRVSVKMTFGAEVFRTSIFPSGDGTHHMMVNRAMREAAGAEPGDTVRVKIEPDTGVRRVSVPPVLRTALAKNAAAKKAFDGFAHSHKKEYVEYITEAKKPETRVRRVEKTIELILAKRRVKE